MFCGAKYSHHTLQAFQLSQSQLQALQSQTVAVKSDRLVRNGLTYQSPVEVRCHWFSTLCSSVHAVTCQMCRMMATTGSSRRDGDENDDEDDDGDQVGGSVMKMMMRTTAIIVWKAKSFFLHPGNRDGYIGANHVEEDSVDDQHDSDDDDNAVTMTMMMTKTTTTTTGDIMRTITYP